MVRQPEDREISVSAADQNVIGFKTRQPQADACVTFHSDGRIEFGEKFRNNPDAAAQEFMRIVREHWPQILPKTGE